MIEVSKTKCEAIWILKGIAIISVVCAHVAYDTSENTVEQIALNLLNTVGTVGVVLFFLISGYLFVYKDEDGTIFWKKKVIRLIPVWLLCGTLVYLKCFQLYNVHNWTEWYVDNIVNFSFRNYLLYVLGYNSLYYFMTMLFCCFIVYRLLIRRNDIVLVLMTAFFLLAQLLGVGDGWFPTQYLNPFNWLGYFGIGCCYKKYVEVKCKEKFIGVLTVLKATLLLGDIILLIVMASRGIVMNYWKTGFLLFAILQVISCCIFCEFVVTNTQMFKKCLIQLGKDSYYIYLLHMLLQSVPINYLHRFGLIGIFLRPIFLIMLIEILLIMIKVLQRLLKAL